MGVAPRDPSRQVETHVLAGHTALSTNGHGGIAHWAFGSVAREVLTAATAATLIVRPRHPPEEPERASPIRTILVPLDGSERAAAALPRRVMLARVVPPAPPAFMAMADAHHVV